MKKIKMVIGRQSVTGVNILKVIVQSSTDDEKERGSNLLVMRILLLYAFKRTLNLQFGDFLPQSTRSCTVNMLLIG